MASSQKALRKYERKKKGEKGSSKRKKWLQIQKQPSSSQNSESNGLVAFPERNGIQRK